jgi:nanoRNase/pAp phosphatase (c-di-AMP/oligoRNAs hydrolase)
MDEREFYSRVRQYDNVLFLCHRNADADSFGSAYALMRLFGGTIGVEDSLSTIAEALASRLGVSAVIRPDPSKYGLTVVVDTSSMIQTGYESLERCAVIDHHEPGDLLGSCMFSFTRREPSTAELVFGVYEKNGARLDCDVAFAMLLAILTDTGHFRYARPATFEAVARILREGGVELSSVMDFLAQAPADISARIAMLKAASRLSLTREGDYLVVASKVSSFGAQAAASLVGLGADVAFVGSELDGEVRISGRLRRGVELDLAALLSEIGTMYGGSGGGHTAAAGLVIKGSVDAGEVLKACVEAAVRRLTAARAQPRSPGRCPL